MCQVPGRLPGDVAACDASRGSSPQVRVRREVFVSPGLAEKSGTFFARFCFAASWHRNGNVTNTEQSTAHHWWVTFLSSVFTAWEPHVSFLVGVWEAVTQI